MDPHYDWFFGVSWARALLAPYFLGIFVIPSHTPAYHGGLLLFVGGNFYVMRIKVLVNTHKLINFDLIKLP